MRIEADAVIDHPRPAVFRAYRDRLPQLVEGLPRIRSIEIEERTEDGPIVRLTNVWYGAAKIPSVAEKVLPAVLSWHDYAVWDESALRAEWRLESHAFPEAVQCAGENVFVDLGDGRTRVEIAGEIRIDLTKVRVMPELIAGKVSEAVERFLVRQITPNLLAVSDALADHLDGVGEQPAAP